MNEDEWRIVGEDDFASALKFYDLSKDNYYEIEMHAERESKRIKCPKLDYFTSEK